MEVTFSSCNRITIPKDVVKQLDLHLGDRLQLDVVSGKIVLTTEKDAENTNKDTQKILTIKVNNTKIYSNLEESKNFSKRYFSDCKLLVRTKNSYIRKVCEQCKGQLELQHRKDNFMCPYNNPSTKIEQKPKVTNEIKKQERDLNIKRSNKRIVEKYKDTVIKPIKCNFNGGIKCSICGETANNIFKVDSKYLCKNCTKKSFNKFFNAYKDLNKEE